MAVGRKTEERLLSADERELVGRARQPAIATLSSGDLSEVIRRLRERRDRARDIAKRQRREMRGKAEPKGATAAGDRGNREKAELLNGALRRAEKERKRREAEAARAELAENARKALAMKQAADAGPDYPVSQTAGEGMRPLPNETATATPGALAQEGYRPVLERSRKVR